MPPVSRPAARAVDGLHGGTLGAAVHVAKQLAHVEAGDVALFAMGELDSLLAGEFELASLKHDSGVEAFNFGVDGGDLGAVFGFGRVKGGRISEELAALFVVLLNLIHCRCWI